MLFALLFWIGSALAEHSSPDPEAALRTRTLAVESCRQAILGEKSPSFSPQYISQLASTVPEAYVLLSESERNQSVALALSERAPNLSHPAFAGLILNGDGPAASGAGSPHANGTLGILASRSPASVLPSVQGVSIYVTHNSSPEALLGVLQDAEKKGAPLPRVINASHGSFDFAILNDGATQSAKHLRALFDYVCQKKLLVNLAAGNGKTPSPIPKKYESCAMRTTSLDSGLMASRGASRGAGINVGAMSDRYQVSVDDSYHGQTSGAAPVVSSALAVTLKAHPGLDGSQLKRIAEASAGPWGEGSATPDAGSGAVNAPKMVLAARLFRSGALKANATIAEIKAKVMQAAEAGEGIPLPPADSAKCIANARTCTELKQCILKISAAFHLLRGNASSEPYRKLLERVFSSSLSSPHLALLFSPRTSQGQRLVSTQLMEKLLEYEPDRNQFESYAKYADLFRSVVLTEANQERLLEKAKRSVSSIPPAGFLATHIAETTWYPVLEKILGPEKLKKFMTDTLSDSKVTAEAKKQWQDYVSKQGW